MIRATKTNDGKIARIEGAPSDVMLFYCVWQAALWPDWLDYARLGKADDSVTKQHKHVVTTVARGAELLLYDDGRQFEAAFDEAVNKCALLGIEVAVTNAAA